jgi:predicted PurR-regulated permease PerM
MRTEGKTTSPARNNDRFRRIFVLSLTLLCALLFLTMIAGFLDALFLAAVFSGFVYPLYRWFESKLGGRRPLASVLTLTVSVLVVLVPFILVLGTVADQAAQVAVRATPWIEQQLRDSSVRGEMKLPGWLPYETELEPYTQTIMAKLAEFATKIGGFLADGLAKISQGTVRFFFELFIMIYAMYFFLMGGSKLIERTMAYVPLSGLEQSEIVKVWHSVSRAMIKGTMVIGVIQGTLAGLGFAVAGIPAPAFWGAVMAILSILPVVGTGLVWVPGVIYLLSTGRVVAGIALLVWCVAVVGTVDNILRPYLVGRDTKLPDLFILLSTLGGIAVFGASGLILGPMLAALFMTVLEIYRRVFADSLVVDALPARPAGD